MKEEKKLFTVSEFGRELHIPLVLAYKLIKWGLIKGIEIIDGTVHITEAGLLEGKELLLNPYRRLKLYWRSLGPGLITGASDDDPSGIATYASVGAKFGYSLLWMSLWLLPMMMAIQEACARIGIVTNKGLSGVLLKHYKKYLVVFIVLLLLIANIVNIGADLGAMAASLQMLLGTNFFVGLLFFTILIIFLEIYLPYEKYVAILKWLSLVLFAYIITALIIHPDWGLILKNLFVPSFQLHPEFIFAMIAFFGTTITPYLFFWQSSQEVEENRAQGHYVELKEKPKKMAHRIISMRNDVKSGMVLSNFVTMFIVITAAEVLFKNGINNIETAEQAAEALRPLAGNYAYVLFAFGIIGMGFMAIPVLAGACAYAVAEVLGVQEGLSRKFTSARTFYLIIAFSILIGLFLNFIGINPIVALYYTAWLNGIIAFPIMVVIMIVGDNKKIMKQETHPLWVKFFGWMAVASMAIGVIASLILSLK